MATYTTVADGNGDFTVSFPANYTGGEKITVTSEKDAATKSIEFYAPSDTIGGGVIQFSGNTSNFPNNIANVSMHGIVGNVGNGAFEASSGPGNIWVKATGLDLLDTSITSIGNYAFSGWSNSTTLVLPETLVSIGDSAFSAWSKLSSLYIPDSVTDINSNAFRSCGAASVHLPENQMFTTIKSTCFNGAKFTEVFIPNNVKTIEGSALASMSNCTKITIGSGIEKILTAAFSGNSNCIELTCLATTPPITAAGAIRINSNAIVKVPSASLAAYQTAIGWSEYANQMVGI